MFCALDADIPPPDCNICLVVWSIDFNNAIALFLLVLVLLIYPCKEDNISGLLPEPAFEGLFPLLLSGILHTPPFYTQHIKMRMGLFNPIPH